jgi:hypothetical protein
MILIDEFFTFLQINKEYTLEDIVSSFCIKELKQSQKRHLAIDLEKNCFYSYIQKLNNIITNGPKCKTNLILYNPIH